MFVKQGGEPGKLRVLHIAGKLSRDKDRSAVTVADPEARMMRAAKEGEITSFHLSTPQTGLFWGFLVISFPLHPQATSTVSYVTPFLMPP